MADPNPIQAELEDLLRSDATGVCFRCFERKPHRGPFCRQCVALLRQQARSQDDYNNRGLPDSTQVAAAEDVPLDAKPEPK